MSEARNECGKIQGLLEAYCEGTLSTARERMVGDHLWQCERCSAELEQIRRLAVALETLPALQPDPMLVAMISSRVAGLPHPAVRRGLLGWRRLGLVELLARAAFGAAWYLIALFGPSLLAKAQPAIAYVHGWLLAARGWAIATYFDGVGWYHGVRAAAPSLGQSLLAIAPKVARYGGAEVALVVTAALALKARRHAAETRRTDCRRS